MKIETGYFRQTIAIRPIHFNILENGKVRPTSLAFTVEIGAEHSLPITLTINGIDIESWFVAMIENKLIKSVDDADIDLFECLNVENTSLPYIVKTLFQILTQLMPDQIHLNSISYE